MADSARLARSLRLLDRVRYPLDLSIDRTGSTLAAALFPAHYERGETYESRIWRIDVGGAGASPITSGPRTETMPRWSPVDDRLAFAADRPVAGRLSLFVTEPGREPEPMGAIEGSVQDARWMPDGSALLVVAVDEGGYGAATDGAIRLRWSDRPPDPDVHRPERGWRRLYRVDAASGRTDEVGPRDASVWEFDIVDGSRVLALISPDPTERGWYRARPAVVDLETRSVGELWTPDLQVQSPSVDPTGTRGALVEGWSSDRGLVAGDIRIFDLDSGERLAFEPGLSDLSWIAWRDPASLWFAGWDGFGSAFGVVRLDGEIEWRASDDAIVGPTSFHARLEPSPDAATVNAIRESLREPPEVVRRPGGADGSWTALTAFNDVASSDLDLYPEVRELRWPGAGGLEIEGLALLPEGSPPFPTVVVIHGGPTWAWKYSFDPGYALPLAAAGFAVFLPNYRGSTGRGQEFTRRNVGDPAGAEFEDILNGIEHVRSLGIAVPDRIGVTGASYGGYLTAWAVSTTDRFAAAVMVSGISDMLSCHLTCNHAFSEVIFEGDHRDPRALELFMERSPITHVAGAKTPTLILHGAEDRCTPLGQAEEFYQGLVLNGTETELVVYPREGHGFRERGHAEDSARRTVAWFERHLEART